MTTHKCSHALRCKSQDCKHAQAHEPIGCDTPAPCGCWPDEPHFQPHVLCIPVDKVKPPEDCPKCGAKRQKGHHPSDCLNFHLDKTRSELIRMAAEILRYPNMPSLYHEEWGFTKGMQITNWRKVYAASDKAQDQCRKWAIKLRSMADKLQSI